MISRELQVTLQLAMTEAVNRRHEYVCLEHLLYAMLHDVTASNILRNCGADLDGCASKLRKYPRRRGRAPAQGQSRFSRIMRSGVQRALQRAALHAQSAGRQEINGGNVLVAMFHETESHAVFFLQEAGRDALRRDQLHLARRLQDRRRRGARGCRGRGRRRRRRRAKATKDGERKLSPAKALQTYAINLTERAAKGKIDPLIGRKNELERAIHVLLRRRKNNPVFVGEAGVGKTALAEGLALAVHQARSRQRSRTSKSMRWIWVRCWPARAFAATSSSGSRR